MKTLFTFFLSTCFIINASGQGLLKRLEDKAKEKTTNRVEQKVDEKMDKTLDRILDGKKQTSSDGDNATGTDQSNPETNDEPQQSKTMQNIQGRIMKKALGSSSCNVQENYTFKHNYSMKVTNTDKKGKSETMSMKIYMGDNMELFAYEIINNSESPEANGSKVIMNGADSSMVMLVNASGMKTGMCNKSYVPTDYNTEEMDEEAQNQADGWVKTGRTKTILGKTCYEHKRIEGTITQIAWIANDGKSMAETMKTMQKNGTAGIGSFASPFGMLMEMTQTDSKTKETMLMQMTEINENSSETISTAGYNLF